MKILGITLGLLLFSSTGYAQDQIKTTVRDVTAEYEMGFAPDFAPTPTPAPSPTPVNPLDINPSVNNTGTPIVLPNTTIPNNTLPTGGFNDTMVKIDRIVALGEKVWNFLVTNKPSADYEVFKTSVVPEGITSWMQLMKWSKPVSKVYRVEFTNAFGASAGGFDYRITYFHSGSYKGKGKFIGQISVVPTNIKLGTDRSLKMRVELASVINFGDEVDPIAGAQVIITWSSPTTTKYQMQSAEYLIYGTGEITDLSNGY